MCRQEFTMLAKFMKQCTFGVVYDWIAVISDIIIKNSFVLKFTIHSISWYIHGMFQKMHLYNEASSWANLLSIHRCSNMCS